MGNLELNNGLVFIEGELKKKNIKICNGNISEISQQNYKNGINCENKWILPGFIDAHVHFRNPGYEYKESWESASKAALSGGITTILDMPNTNPPTTTIKELENKRNTATKNSKIDFGFHFGATNDNIEEIKKLTNIASIKIYFGSSTGELLLNKEETIKKIAELNKFTLSFHAEDELLINKNKYSLKEKDYKNPLIHSIIRNEEVAVSAIKKILNYTQNTNSPIYLCHISSKKELNLIKKAKQHRNIYCEATPHHLFLTNQIAIKIGQLAKVNPPLRNKENQEYLLKALYNQNIDTIGTDHAPHTIKDKSKSYKTAPAGMPGLESCVALFLSEINKNNLKLKQLVKLYSENPAKIFKIKNKAFIKLGYKGDFSIINPKKEWTLKQENIYSKANWNPFINKKMTGKVETVILKGKIAYKNNIFYNSKGEEVNFG